MTGPHGHPAQHGFGGSGFPRPQRGPNPATTVVAGVLGLLVAGVVGSLPVPTFIHVGLGEIPGRILIVYATFLVAGIVLLFGALTTFFRVLAGGILLIVGAVLTLGSLALEPPLYLHDEWGQYLHDIFDFRDWAATGRAIVIFTAPLVLVFATLPPTFSYLRWRPARRGYFPQYPPGARW